MRTNCLVTDCTTSSSNYGAPFGPGSPLQFLNKTLLRFNIAEPDDVLFCTFYLFMVKKNGSVAAAVLFNRKAVGFPLRSLAQLVKMRITVARRCCLSLARGTTLSEGFSPRIPEQYRHAPGCTIREMIQNNNFF